LLKQGLALLRPSDGTSRRGAASEQRKLRNHIPDSKTLSAHELRYFESGQILANSKQDHTVPRLGNAVLLGANNEVRWLRSGEKVGSNRSDQWDDAVVRRAALGSVQVVNDPMEEVLATY